MYSTEITSAWATDVSDWTELKNNRDEEKLALGSRYTGSYDVYTTSLATTV